MRVMKILKIIIAASLLLMPAAVFAQDMEDDSQSMQQEEVQKPNKKSKKALELPKAGDFGIGVDLVPVLRYVGNIFTGVNDGNGTNYTEFGGEQVLINNVVNPAVSIMGRYMITDNWVARINFGIIADVTQTAVYVPDDAAREMDPMSQAKVIDSRKHSMTGGSVALGVQYRFGKRRVQGYAGADLIYGFGIEKNEYSYGNAITELNQIPSRHPWENPIMVPSQWSNDRAFVLSSSNVNGAASHVFGAGLNIGMEIFLTSYMSLGGEISFTFLGTYVPQQYQVLEGFNTYNNTVETWTQLVSPETYSFHCGTENLGGKLYMMFYF